MSPSQAALAHQAERAELADTTARAGAQAWRGVDPQRIPESWASLLLQVLGLVSGAQLRAAQQTEPWLTGAVGPARDAGDLVPSTFSGHASDGRPLFSLLMFPAWAALHALAKGLGMPQALTGGATLLDLLIRTQVADAGRAADSVGMAIRDDVYGYQRVVSLPACARCIVLAGRLYRWSDGFQRHPRCDCTMEPVTYDEWRSKGPKSTPDDLFSQMSAEQQSKVFTAAGARAIRDGADLGQVVNARRGMQTATAYRQQVQATTEGTTKRGLFGGYEIGEDGSLRRRDDSELIRRPGSRYRSAKTPRLMPQEIYERAEDREHALRLLRKFAYVRPKA